MNTLRFAIIAIALSSISWGCKRFDEFTQFELDYKQSITIPASSVVNLPFNLMTPEVESNAESEFEVNDTRKDLIQEIKLTNLDFVLTSPSDGNFNFLKSIEIFIQAEGLNERRIAFKQNIESDGSTSLDLETVDVDLQEYIKKDRFTLRVETKTDEALTRDHDIDILSTFFVDAKLIK